MFAFRIKHKDTKTAARVGECTTAHGSFATPAFMPCATYGAVKTVTPDELRACGAEIVLSNTFHLHLRPGEQLVKKFGGIQDFMRWDGPILTDSGGFQVFSLAQMRKIYDDRVEFRSPVDGSAHTLTPAKVFHIQRDLGSDIAMQLDECVPGDASFSIAETALTRTQRWAEESVREWQKAMKKGSHTTLFPIVQGASHADLRRRSADFCAALPTPGVAIGGLAVGETKAQFLDALETVLPRLPLEKPRYLMGVGEPADIVAAVARGVDMFDCVIPTRLARHGSFFTRTPGVLGKRENIEKAVNRESKAVLQRDCPCPACVGGYTRGYLRHLYVTHEPLAARLLTLHNLTYIFGLMRTVRTHITAGTLAAFARKYGTKG